MGFETLQPDLSAEQLLDLAAKAGAEAAEVFQTCACSQPVFFEANRLKQLETNQCEGTALRLWHNSRPGLAVAYGQVDPARLVERAIALSQLNQPETPSLTTGQEVPSPIAYPDVGHTVPVDQLIAWGQETIALIRQAYPEVLCSGDWECEAETTRLINSAGLDCYHCDTTLSSFLTAEWVRGDDFLNVSDGQIQRDYLDPKALATQVLQRLDWAKHNVALPSRRLPVLFTAKAADMLWGTVQAALNGKQILEGASPWSGRLGEQVLSSKVTVSQQPEVGPFSCPFDDEGTPTRNLVFIQDGVLQLVYADRTSGQSLGSGTTGNGFRPSLGSYPTPGLFNFLIQPGCGASEGRSLTELISDLTDGLIVDQMLGSGAGISGEFSVNVELGYRIHQGEIIGRVKDTMITGNVYTALQHLAELGSDAEWNGACLTPSVLVEGISITGRP